LVHQTAHELGRNDPEFAFRRIDTYNFKLAFLVGIALVETVLHPCREPLGRRFILETKAA
jgi:hypothetical protein